MSNDKGSTKIPLMNDSRHSPGIRRGNGLHLLPRQHGAIAPDHPPKQIHAWVSIHLEVERYTNNCSSSFFAPLKLWIKYETPFKVKHLWWYSSPSHQLFTIMSTPQGSPDR